jgi:hypothetical protein
VAGIRGDCSAASAALRCTPARRRDRGVLAEGGFAGYRLHGAGAKRRAEEAGRKPLAARRGTAPLSNVRDRHPMAAMLFAARGAVLCTASRARPGRGTPERSDVFEWRTGCLISAALDRPRSSGRLTPSLVGCVCALDATGHRVARVGAAFSRALRSSVATVGPVGVPARLRACSPARSRQRRSAGRSGRRRCTPASSPADEVGAVPTWHRNSLGVGRVARRARPDTKPYSR